MDLNKKQLQMSELPEWLQKLWQISPMLARQAENDYINLKKQLTIHNVSQRSELLKSFADWLQGEVWDDKHDDFSDYVEDYIKTL